MSIKHRITKITIEHKKYLIEIDGEYRLFLYARDLNKSKQEIAEEAELSEEELNTLEMKVVERGRKRIMYLLGKQDYPQKKLEEKLLFERYHPEHIDLILKPFLNKGFVSDKKLIQRKVNGFKTYKSKKEIEYKLKSNGFQQEDIKEAIADELDEDAELESAKKLLEKRYYLKRFKLEEKELKKKAIGYLSRKGYPVSICFKAFDWFINESDKS